jgi:regulator of sigma E protease
MNTLTQFAANLGWWIAIAIPAFLIVLTLIVFVHELGHFLMARLCGVRVESFSIGFGRALVGFHDRHGTYWKIGWLPLGGYVKFWGDAGVSSNPDHEVVDKASAAERAQSFHHKPVSQRALIAAAGPAANFVLAITIWTVVFMTIGDSVMTPQIGTVVPKTPAATAGFEVGDRVLAIDGTEIREFSDLQRAVSLSGDRTMTFLVARGSRRVTLHVKPVQMERKDPLGHVMKDSMIGVRPVIPTEVGHVRPESPAAKAGLRAGDIVFQIDATPVADFDDMARLLTTPRTAPLKFQFARATSDDPTKAEMKVMSALVAPQPVAGTARSGDATVEAAVGLIAKIPGSPQIESAVVFGPLEAVSRACGRTWFIVAKSLDFVGRLLTGRGDTRQLSGPIGIAQVSGQIMDKMGVGGLIGLLAVLSVSIGLLNLFPIPMLDGGHLLYYGIEAVRGRPLGEKAQELGFQIGLALVVGLMLIATWNDLLKVPA